MNNNSICNCCYNTANLVKKCDFDHHQICNDCSKEYSLRFRRRNCMFCDPHGINHTSFNSSRLSNNELYCILLCNVFLTFALFAFIFLILILMAKMGESLKDIVINDDFLNIYFKNYCNSIQSNDFESIDFESNNFEELIYCNF